MSRDNERMTCGNCRFWDELPNGDGLCRRHAPRPVHEVAVTDATTEHVNRYFAFPLVLFDDWCGELEPTEVEQ